MIDRFDLEYIKPRLKLHKIDNYHVVVFDKLDSTQTYALDNCNTLGENKVVVCEEQTKGYGRNGKSWYSRQGIDITASFVHKFALDFEYELLPLVMAVAVNRLFKQQRISTKVKWPNDIMLSDGVKVAGVLQAGKIAANSRYIITGIGINNINNTNRNDLLVSLILQVNAVISEYKVFGFALFRQEWLDNCIHYQKPISLYRGNILLGRGIHTDLTADGKIRIRDISNGNVSEYSGSKISLITEE